jgi:hypothetical protein
VICTRIIAVGWSLWVEDDMGNLTGSPLMSEQGTEFAGRAANVDAGEPEGYERAVPTPLMRVEVRGGTGPASHIVLT